ncbi:Coenzyme F420 hydrogenase/dehydrogenase, beta subunit C-terminal domain [Cognatishimia sp.]|uniref:Coenzyme F420 hydrogenase/dehydrogenase, beta subunit C-terminal domain n=1 Tax=Cognatishimia sp. TaxID=2211648 RepID=UPI0035136B0D
MVQTAKSVAEVVTSGLCIGCGLCETVSNGRVRMRLSDVGGLRPMPLDGFQGDEEAKVLRACPGVVAMPRIRTEAESDPIWGAYSSMQYAWAGDADVRYRGATGGVLTALGMHLLESGQADFILHVRAIPDQPMRNEWVMSETPAEVLAHAGSRYAPAAPLAGLKAALDRDQPFALIAKPCDIAAVHAFAKEDPRVDRLCIARMVMVCGGQSRIGKSQKLLRDFGLREDELSLFRYRGFGNPGLTTVETKDGRQFTTTYNALWDDEGTWELETRCKLCPDAMGEAADIAAADVWPGGGPTGEDAGFNGIIVRSPIGEAIVAAATAAGHLVLGDAITPKMFNDFQPHQLRKKHAVEARLSGLEQAALPRIDTRGLRLEALGEALSEADKTRQVEGIQRRVAEGRVQEALPKPLD